MEDLDFTAVLIDEITPIFDRILASLEAVSTSFMAAAETMTAAMDSVALASEGAAGGSESFVASVEGETVALSESTASITENTAALTDNAAASAGSSSANDTNMGSLKGTASSMAVVGLAAAAAGGATFLMGTQSETAFNTLQAMAGVSADQMGSYRQAVDETGVKFGKTTTEMANGLYYVVSAGFSGADAITVLDDATMAAAASNTDMKVTADALTSAMNAYGVDASQAGNYTDIMTQAVVQGKQQFSDFASSIGVAAVQGRVAGVSFAEVASAEATMTQSGLSAHRAVMNLDFLMRNVGLSTQVVADKAKKLGFEFDSNAYSTMTLMEKLQYLKSISGDNVAGFEKLTGGANGLTAAAILLSKNGSTYNGILDTMKNSSGSTAQAFATHTATTKYAADVTAASYSVLADKFQKLAAPTVNTFLEHLSTIFTDLAGNGDALKNILAGLAIVIGGALTIAVISLLAALTPLTIAFILIEAAAIMVVTHTKEISALWNSTSDTAILFKAAVIGLGAGLAAFAIVTLPPLIIGFGSLAVAVIAATWPFILIGVAVAIVVAIIALAITHWKQIQKVIEDVAKACWQAITSVWNAIYGFFGSVFGAIGSAVSGFVNGFISLIVGFVTSVSTHISSGFTAVSGVISGILSGIGTIIRTAVTFYISAFKMMIDWVLGLFQWLYEHNKYIELMVKDIGIFIGMLRADITKVLTAIQVFVMAAFTTIKTNATTIWNGITTSISVAVHMIQATISAVWNAIAAFFGIIMSIILQALQADWQLFQTYILGPLHWVWNEIVSVGNSIMGFFSGLWSWLSSATATAWADFSGAIGGAAGTVLGAAGNIVTAISGVLGSLASKALEWGQNMIKGFISGIGNMAGGVKDAVGNIMSNVGGFLGFHSPTKEGPGAEADQWGPNLIKMFARGITDTGGEAAGAASGVAGIVQNRLGGGSGGLVRGGGGGGGSSFAGTANNGGATSVTINLNGGLGAGLQLLTPADRQRLMSQIASELGKMVNLQSSTLSGYTGA